MKLPLGCHLGFWHRWGRWNDRGEVIKSTQVLPNGPKVQTGKLIIQERECPDCGAKQFRGARM